MTDRYDVSQKPEAQYQAGSNDRVLRNKRGITDPTVMEELEFDLLGAMQEHLFEEIAMDQRLSANDLCDWHRLWLQSVYDWAGDYRNVNMAKDDFPFAAAHLIPRLMQEYERECLGRYTPCDEMQTNELTEALAVCHVEFILIHPFREGNGRLARVLATVMALQANGPLLNFSKMEQQNGRYVRAIHQGHDRRYDPMKQIFSEILADSLP